MTALLATETVTIPTDHLAVFLFVVLLAAGFGGAAVVLGVQRVDRTDDNSGGAQC